ncbi:MAG: T9SS type A sorting domain-containing protein [Bacteroidia bacterium]
MFNIKTYTVIMLSAFFMNAITAKPALSQNNGEDQFKLTAYPNPSSSTLTINYQLPQNTPVKLMIFSVDGSVGKVLFAGNRTAGEYNETYDISTLAPGQYFYQLQTDTDLVTKSISMVSGAVKQN